MKTVIQLDSSDIIDILAKHFEVDNSQVAISTKQCYTPIECTIVTAEVDISNEQSRT